MHLESVAVKSVGNKEINPYKTVRTFRVQLKGNSSAKRILCDIQSTRAITEQDIHVLCGSWISSLGNRIHQLSKTFLSMWKLDLLLWKSHPPAEQVRLGPSHRRCLSKMLWQFSPSWWVRPCWVADTQSWSRYEIVRQQVSNWLPWAREVMHPMGYVPSQSCIHFLKQLISRAPGNSDVPW